MNQDIVSYLDTYFTTNEVTRETVQQHRSKIFNALREENKYEKSEIGKTLGIYFNNKFPKQNPPPKAQPAQSAQPAQPAQPAQSAQPAHETSDEDEEEMLQEPTEAQRLFLEMDEQAQRIKIYQALLSKPIQTFTTTHEQNSV